MNNKDKVDTPDSENINIHENYDVEHWATLLNVTPNRLREIVKETGTNVAYIKAYLNN